MTQQCHEGSAISISCAGFKNPIYQDLWNGFYVEFWDSEGISKKTEQSNPKGLDATSYEPAQLQPDTLQIEPADTTINSQSTWTLYLNPTVPLGKECYIRLYLPTDLSYEFNFVSATGIFLPQGQTMIVPTSDLSFEPPKGAELRQAIKFTGCSQISSLG